MADDYIAVANDSAATLDAAPTDLNVNCEDEENENFQDVTEEEEERDSEDGEKGNGENKAGSKEGQIRRSPRINKGKPADRYGWW